MIDTEKIKRTTDLLALIGRDTKLAKVSKGKDGDEYAGPCPICNDGRDRFRVWPSRAGGGRWWCRVCNKSGDAIQYLIERERLTFGKACEMLGSGELLQVAAGAQLEAEAPQVPAGAPAGDWQEQAMKVIEECEAALWGGPGLRARNYLHERGLNDATMRRWRIGYNAGEGSRRIAGLKVSCGIVVPGIVAGECWFINVRRAVELPKYKLVYGSRHALLGAETLGDHETAVICEGEFDAMLLEQHTGDLVGVGTMGSAGGWIDLEQWGEYLFHPRRLLLAADTDKAGDKMAERLGDMTARARRLDFPIPVKDVTDLYKAGVDLRQWVIDALLKDGDLSAPVLPEAMLAARACPGYVPGLPMRFQTPQVENAWWSSVSKERGIYDDDFNR